MRWIAGALILALAACGQQGGTSAEQAAEDVAAGAQEAVESAGEAASGMMQEAQDLAEEAERRLE